MASNLFFNRHTRVYLKQGTNIWEIPVLSGYSFSQTTNSSQVTLNEMSDATGVSRRGQQAFNDSLSPAEWSFDVYARPTLVTGTPNRMRAVEEPLWANMAAVNAYTAGTNSWTSGVTIGAATLDFDFNASNKTTLGTFDLYFVLGASKQSPLDDTVVYPDDTDTTIYKISNCVVNEATMNFEIDGIATISWSGMGSQITEVKGSTFDTSSAIVTGIATTTNMIRNRLTALTATSSVSGSLKTYDITLTGGSITISNNISFLTPETIGIVNVPLGHVTGTRSVSGSFTAYLDTKTNGTADLYADLLSATTVVTNSFDLNFYVGGKSADDQPTGPGIQFDMGQCHLEVPSVNIDDVIGVEMNFTALPSTISGTNEITKIRYVGV